MRAVAEATCGVTITLSMRNSGFSAFAGSTSKTSSAAPAMAPASSARTSAASSTVGPRPLFTKMADGFMAANSRSPSRWRVSAFRGACMETKSERSSSSMSPTGSTPSAVIVSSLTYGSKAMTWRPKGWQRRATARAMLPKETRPTVCPQRRGTSLKTGRPSRQRPSPVRRSMSLRRRAAASSRASVWSATSSTNTSGTFVTTMPASVAASTSTVSAPTLARPMTTQRSSPAMTLAVMRLPEAMRASASRAAAANSASSRAAICRMSAPMGSSASRS